MSPRIFTAALFLLGCTPLTVLHAKNKSDKKTIKQLQTDISYLASDELEGRRTSTEGERKAADYIEKRYKDIGVKPYKEQYRVPFHFTYGKEASGSTAISVNNTLVPLNGDNFALPFSGGGHVASEVQQDIMEQGSIWMIALYNDAEQADNPHFEAEKFMYERAKEAEKQGASGVVFFDGYGSKYNPSFNRHSEYDAVGIPVAFLSNDAYVKYIKEAQRKGSGIPIDLNISIVKSDRSANNLAAYIDNGAKYTVILGAHYDHLGFGEDGNSLFANAKKEHQIHHGADDNASGTAALLATAKWVKSKKLHNFNYLFVNFSGEELGLYGSKAFVKDMSIDSAKVAYMINMDMVGRLNDSTHALTVGGVGTSPVWAEAVNMAGDDFKVVIDSSGVGPSDHTSFYNAGIPVLFFFTGTHKDYHKPSDRAELINYAGEAKVLNYVTSIVAKMDKDNLKPDYTITKQPTVGATKFKVTLGIMPDYTFQEGGVRVDGVSDGRPAIKAGIKQGDIIIMLGKYKVNGMQTYMEALGKFTPGEKTEVTVQRDGKNMVLPLEFMAK